MNVPFFLTQRWWWYRGLLLARRMPLRRRRDFMARWDAAYDLWLAPIHAGVFWVQHPRLYLDVRRCRRLVADGRTEISA